MKLENILEIFLKKAFLKALALQSEAAKKYDAKKSVWVPDPEDGFIAADIKSNKGDQYIVYTAKGNEVRFDLLGLNRSVLSNWI